MMFYEPPRPFTWKVGHCDEENLFKGRGQLVGMVINYKGECWAFFNLVMNLFLELVLPDW